MFVVYIHHPNIKTKNVIKIEEKYKNPKQVLAYQI